METKRVAAHLTMGLAAALMLSGCGSEPTSPTEVTTAFYEAMDEGDYGRACEYIAPEDADDMSEGCEARMASRAERLPTDIEVTGEHINEAESTAEVTLRAEGEPGKIAMKKISGQWLLAGNW